MAGKVLVTGGAGYIGSHACKALARAGYTPVTFDNFVTGWRDAVRFGPLVEGDLLDRAALDQAFAEHTPVAVLHFAALSLVGEAMSDPARYWRNNVTGALNLLEAMVAAECRQIVFSSTCATYGEHDNVVLDEMTPQEPLNAYGKSKRAIEDMIGDFRAAHGLRSVIFRYFNVAGADPEGEIGEHHRPETHLIPVMFEAIQGKRPALTIHGTDYDTPDGTCIRDYVHVSDLVDAHLLGLRWLENGQDDRVFNLGTGTGFSVREVIAASRMVTNHDVPMNEGPRRAGDATKLVSGSDRAAHELGWTPERSSMTRMIEDAWRWQQHGHYEH
ncbi:UDP-glucose 4-epimerase GalE [Roseivivax sp. CAU 1753]